MSRFDFLPRGRGRAPVAERKEPVIARPVAAVGGVSDAGWREVGFGGHSRVSSLPRVSAEVAQKLGTVVTACSVISGDLSKLPLALYQRGARGREDRVRDHPVEYLLNSTSVVGVPAHVMRFGLAYSFTLRGRAYAYAPRDAAGEVELIEAIHPDQCSVLRLGRERYYDFVDGAEVPRRVSGRVMAHLRYMAEDGWTGRSPIEVAAETIGIALAGQEAAARLSGGKSFKAVAKIDAFNGDDEDWQRARTRLKGAMGRDADDGVVIIGPTDDIKTIGMSAADLDLLASRRFDREQIAGLYRVPPSKLQLLEHGVKANGEQQAIDYKAECLTHWGAFVESGLGQTLLTERERAEGLFLRHDYDALLTATTKERYEALVKAVGGPILTPNEGRDEEGLGPLAGGDVLYPPPNMTRETKEIENG